MLEENSLSFAIRKPGWTKSGKQLMRKYECNVIFRSLLILIRAASFSRGCCFDSLRSLFLLLLFFPSSPLVNFINVKCTNFLYKHRVLAAFSSYMYEEKWRSYEKFVREMLMKLTPSLSFSITSSPSLSFSRLSFWCKGLMRKYDPNANG